MIQAYAQLHDRLPLTHSEVLEAKPTFPKAEVLRYLAGGNGGLPSKKVLRKMEQLTERMDSIAEPKLAYSIEGVAGISKTSVILQNGVVFRAPKLARSLKDSFAVVCFVGTVGPEIDEEIERLRGRNSISDAFVADTLASVAAEQLVEKFHREMDIYYRQRDAGVSLRFSPGYCDWPIVEQDKLFSLVDSDLVGVELLDSHLMMPRKSVSGVFGLTWSGSGKNIPYNPCVMCGKKDCTARRKPSH